MIGARFCCHGKTIFLANRRLLHSRFHIHWVPVAIKYHSMIAPLTNSWALQSQTCYSWGWAWWLGLSCEDWERCLDRDNQLEWSGWFIIQVIWLFWLSPCTCRENEGPHHRFSGWTGSLLRDVYSLLARRMNRRWLVCLVGLLTPRTWAESRGSYLFEVRGVSFKSLLDLRSKELGWSDSEFLAFLAINSHELLSGVIVVLDLLLRSHL